MTTLGDANVVDPALWDNWSRAARTCGARYRRSTEGYPQAQLGPMMILGTATLVAGEHGHVVTGRGTAFERVSYSHPSAANEN